MRTMHATHGVTQLLDKLSCVREHTTLPGGVHVIADIPVCQLLEVDLPVATGTDAIRRPTARDRVRATPV